jgi:hypothetical protein
MCTRDESRLGHDAHARVIMPHPLLRSFLRIVPTVPPGLDRPMWPTEPRTIPAFELKIGPAKARATGAVPPGLSYTHTVR